MHNINNSKVGRIKAEMELCNAAARYAMCGPSQGSSSHKIISYRMKRTGELHEDLKGVIGPCQAGMFLIKTMDEYGGSSNNG